MAALTENTLPVTRAGREFAFPVKTAVHIYAGAMVAVDATGYALPAADAANQNVIGFATAEADNTSGASGALQIVVNRHDAIALDNSSANPVTRASTGKVVYVEDDHTVGTAVGTNSIKAGVCLGLDPDSAKVWVEIEHKA